MGFVYRYSDTVQSASRRSSIARMSVAGGHALGHGVSDHTHHCICKAETTCIQPGCIQPRARAATAVSAARGRAGGGSGRDGRGNSGWVGRRRHGKAGYTATHKARARARARWGRGVASLFVPKFQLQLDYGSAAQRPAAPVVTSNWQVQLHCPASVGRSSRGPLDWQAGAR